MEPSYSFNVGKCCILLLCETLLTVVADRQSIKLCHMVGDNIGIRLYAVKMWGFP